MLTVAALDLVLVTGAGQRRDLRIRIGMPADGDGAWACAVELEGLHGGLSPVFGEDALQALCLALALAASLLRDAIAQGGRLEYPTGEDFPLDAYFGSFGRFDAHPARGPAG